MLKEKIMTKNIAEFRIIGNVGKKRERDKVTYVSVGANYNRRDGDDWKSETLWTSVVCFSNVAQQVENVSTGDLVHVTGRVRESSHGDGDHVQYRPALIADTLDRKSTRLNSSH